MITSIRLDHKQEWTTVNASNDIFWAVCNHLVGLIDFGNCKELLNNVDFSQEIVENHQNTMIGLAASFDCKNYW